MHVYCEASFNAANSVSVAVPLHWRCTKHTGVTAGSRRGCLTFPIAENLAFNSSHTFQTVIAYTEASSRNTYHGITLHPTKSVDRGAHADRRHPHKSRSERQGYVPARQPVPFPPECPQPRPPPSLRLEPKSKQTGGGCLPPRRKMAPGERGVPHLPFARRGDGARFERGRTAARQRGGKAGATPVALRLGPPHGHLGRGGSVSNVLVRAGGATHRRYVRVRGCRYLWAPAACAAPGEGRGTPGSLLCRSFPPRRAEGGRRGGRPAPPVPLPGMRGAPGTWRRREAGDGRSRLTGAGTAAGHWGPAFLPPGECWRRRRRSPRRPPEGWSRERKRSEAGVAPPPRAPCAISARRGRARRWEGRRTVFFLLFWGASGCRPPASAAELQSVAGPAKAAPVSGAASRPRSCPFPRRTELPALRVPTPAGTRWSLGQGRSCGSGAAEAASREAKGRVALPLSTNEALLGDGVSSRLPGSGSPSEQGQHGTSPSGPEQPCGGTILWAASYQSRRCLRGAATPRTGPTPCRPPERRGGRCLTGARRGHASPGRGGPGASPGSGDGSGSAPWPPAAPSRPWRQEMRLPLSRSSLPRRLLTAEAGEFLGNGC